MTSPRYLFGSGAADFAIAPPSRHGGFVVSAASLGNGTLWTASTGGSQYSDLETVNGGAVNTVSTDADGALVPFYGPPGVDEAWLDFGGGSRTLLTASRGQDAHAAELINDSASATRVTLDGAFPKKATGAVYVTDYALVGDGVANDTTALQSFVTAASGKVVKADGVYAVTGSIANLHGPRYRGAGRVTRSGVTFYLDPSGTQTNTIYVDPAGSDTNDGITSALPKQTIQGAFDVLASYGPTLSGNWVVQLAAGTYPIGGTQGVLSTPSLNRVIVKGPDVGGSPNVPTAVLDGAGGAAYTHGLRSSGNGVLAEFRDIKAINFTAGGGDTTRIGFVAENNADLLTTNVHATGATWCGVYGFSAARLRVYGGILDGCRSGVIVNAVEATVGGAGVQQVYVRNSTESGIYWSRGSQGHVDYVTFEDNAIGLRIAENSRVDTVANTFKRNSYAIRAQTGGLWGEGGTPNTYGTGADVNPNGIQGLAFSGNSVELEGSAGWSRVAYDRTTRTLTGTTSLTTLTTPYTLPADRMTGAGKSCRVYSVGVFTAITAGSVMTVNFGGLAFSVTVPAAATNAAFELDVTLYEVAGGYRAIGRISQGLNGTRFATATAGFTAGSAQAISIAATPANVADSIALYRTDVYLMG